MEKRAYPQLPCRPSLYDGLFPRVQLCSCIPCRSSQPRRCTNCCVFRSCVNRKDSIFSGGTVFSYSYYCRIDFRHGIFLFHPLGCSDGGCLFCHRWHLLGAVYFLVKNMEGKPPTVGGRHFRFVPDIHTSVFCLFLRRYRRKYLHHSYCSPRTLPRHSQLDCGRYPFALCSSKAWCPKYGPFQSNRSPAGRLDGHPLPWRNTNGHAMVGNYHGFSGYFGNITADIIDLLKKQLKET